MPSPTLVVGLGGTGDWALVHTYRNLIAQHGKVPDEVKLLLVDTDGVTRVEFDGTRLPKEYVLPIGGPITDLSEQVQSDPDENPELSWYKAGWFNPIGGTVLNLSIGASRFRQLGRMAIFDNIRSGKQTLAANLETAISAIHTKQNNWLMVCLVGSLCGGSGSGMFIDVAHLIRRIAHAKGFPQSGVMLRGFLVLPQAYDGTLNPDEDTQKTFRARSFSGLRELTRFSGLRWPKGTPMVYDHKQTFGTSANDVLKSQLFEALYLVDGRRSLHTLDKVEIQYGVAPAIADTIAVLIDSQAKNVVESYHANIASAAKTHSEKEISSKGAPTVGTIGCYSIIWPWDVVVEEWSHRLMHELLDKLNEPSGFEEQIPRRPTNIRDDRRGGYSSNSGADDAQELYSQDQFGKKDLERLVQAVLSWQNREKVNPKKAAEEFQTQLFEENLLESFRSRWDQADKSNFELLDKTAGSFLWPLQRDKPGSKQGGLLEQVGIKKPQQEYCAVPKPGREHLPKTAAEDLSKRMKTFIAGYLGAEQGGRRVFDKHTPAKFLEALNTCAEEQEEHFEGALLAWLEELLNGTSPDAREADLNRSGKLGYARSYLNQLMKNFQSASVFIVDQMKHRRDESMPKMRVNIENAEAAMKTDKRQQEQFLKAWDERLNLEKWLWAAQAHADSALRLAQMCRLYHGELVAWVKALFTDTEGLYAEVSKRKKKGSKHREEEQKLNEVREIIRRGPYEDDCYNQVVEDSGTDMGLRNWLLDQVKWEIGRENSQPKVVLKIANQTLKRDSINEQYGWLFKKCQEGFERTKNYRSLLQILYTDYDFKTDALEDSKEKSAANMADALRNRYAPLLLLNNNGSTAHQSVYLRWFDDPIDSTQNALQPLLKGALEGGDPANPHRITFLPSEDRFRLSCITFYDLILYKHVKAYDPEGFESYRIIPQTCQSGAGNFSREIAHVLPGEVYAAQYEPLGQNAKLEDLLAEDIVDGLNDPQRFERFKQACIYGTDDRFISSHLIPADDPKHPSKWVWRLVLQPLLNETGPTGKKLPAKEYWLTDPAREEEQISLVQALRNYVLGRIDYRTMNSIEVEVDGKLDDELRRARIEDLQRREKNGDLGNSCPEYLSKLNTVAGQQRGEAKSKIAKLDRYREREDDWEKEPEKYQQKGDRSNSQLYNIFLADIRRESSDLRKALASQLAIR
jgi:hypothetical protein